MEHNDLLAIEIVVKNMEVGVVSVNGFTIEKEVFANGESWTLYTEDEKILGEYMSVAETMCAVRNFIKLMDFFSDEFFETVGSPEFSVELEKFHKKFFS